MDLLSRGSPNLICIWKENNIKIVQGFNPKPLPEAPFRYFSVVRPSDTTRYNKKHSNFVALVIAWTD